MTHKPGQPGGVASLAEARPALEIQIVLGRDGSFAVAIEPDDAPLSAVLGVLEMAKFAAAGQRMTPVADSHARDMGLDCARHIDRRERRERRERKTKGEPT